MPQRLGMMKWSGWCLSSRADDDERPPVVQPIDREVGPVDGHDALQCQALRGRRQRRVREAHRPVRVPIHQLRHTLEVTLSWMLEDEVTAQDHAPQRGDPGGRYSVPADTLLR